jgi:hypothetical protein
MGKVQLSYKAPLTIVASGLFCFIFCGINIEKNYEILK